jgi:transketolase
MTSLLSSTHIRKIILQYSRQANVGHIGSCLSIVEILAALYSHILNIPSPPDPDRDRFVLSKGHAALALYATLFLKGILPQELLDTFCGDGSVLGVHPEHIIPGIDFSTGSLGQGLSFGAGAALAARLQGSKRRVFVLVSDAECNEGALWEAIMFAAHHRLANLVAIVDANGQQALGYTRDVLDLSPLIDRWRAFEWDVHEVDGHNIPAMVDTFSQLETVSGPPHVIIAHTVFGKGVSYMQGQIEWHYMPMSESQYSQALHEIGEEA